MHAHEAHGTSHWHRCDCGHRWEHSEASQGCEECHRCQACGRVEWIKETGKGNPELEGIIALLALFRRIENANRLVEPCAHCGDYHHGMLASDHNACGSLGKAARVPSGTDV